MYIGKSYMQHVLRSIFESILYILTNGYNILWKDKTNTWFWQRKETTFKRKRKFILKMGQKEKNRWELSKWWVTIHYLIRAHESALTYVICPYHMHPTLFSTILNFLLRIYRHTTKDIMWITFIHHTSKPYTYKYLFIRFVIYLT